MKCHLPFVATGLIALATHLAGSAIAATPPSSAPATSPTTATKVAELAVTEADSGKTLKLGANTGISISLAGNATTGYSWSIAKIEGSALEQVGDIQYVPHRAQPGMVGGGGTSVAKFRAVKTGQS